MKNVQVCRRRKLTHEHARDSVERRQQTSAKDAPAAGFASVVVVVAGRNGKNKLGPNSGRRTLTECSLLASIVVVVAAAAYVIIIRSAAVVVVWCRHHLNWTPPVSKQASATEVNDKLDTHPLIGLVDHIMCCAATAAAAAPVTPFGNRVN